LPGGHRVRTLTPLLMSEAFASNLSTRARCVRLQTAEGICRLRQGGWWMEGGAPVKGGGGVGITACARDWRSHTPFRANVRLWRLYVHITFPEDDLNEVACGHGFRGRVILWSNDSPSQRKVPRAESVSPSRNSLIAKGIVSSSIASRVGHLLQVAPIESAAVRIFIRCVRFLLCCTPDRALTTSGVLGQEDGCCWWAPRAVAPALAAPEVRALGPARIDPKRQLRKNR
jgi:hypothetical protein